MRLSLFLTNKYGISRRFAKELISSGKVVLGKSIITKDIEVSVDADYTAEINKPKLEFNVSDYLISEYSGLLFFDKPSLMHSERINPTDGLCLSDVAESLGCHLISRLDHEVDGIIGAVREGCDIISQQKQYFALVSGVVKEQIKGVWSVENVKGRRVNVIENIGVFVEISPVTDLISSKSHTLVNIKLEKAGRHMVRAVCAHLGYPLAGDKLYGAGAVLHSVDADRVMLHCHSVTLNGVVEHSKLTKNFLELANRLVSERTQ